MVSSQLSPIWVENIGLTNNLKLFNTKFQNMAENKSIHVKASNLDGATWNPSLGMGTIQGDSQMMEIDFICQTY